MWSIIVAHLSVVWLFHYTQNYEMTIVVIYLKLKLFNAVIFCTIHCFSSRKNTNCINVKVYILHFLLFNDNSDLC
jgi:hypothetical protein